MPGKEDMLIVNEPSLKGGRNERPNVKKHTRATTNKPIVLPSTIFLMVPSTTVISCGYTTAFIDYFTGNAALYGLHN